MCTLQVYENSLEVFLKCDVFFHLSRVLVARELEELEEGEEGEEFVANMFGVYTCEKVRDAHHEIKVSSG